MVVAGQGGPVTGRPSLTCAWLRQILYGLGRRAGQATRDLTSCTPTRGLGRPMGRARLQDQTMLGPRPGW